MNQWITRGLLITSVLSVGVVAAASARAAAAIATSSALTGANSAKGETSLGNLVADALKRAAKSDIGLLPANSLQEKELDPKADSPEAIKKVIASPSSELVMLVRVSGKDLKTALSRSLSLYPRKNQGFLQVSGLTVTFDPARTDEGRVLEVRVNGETLNPDRTYTVAMPESLAKGGLGYFNLWDPKDAKPVTDAKGAKVTLVEAIQARMKEGKVTLAPEGRVKAKS